MNGLVVSTGICAAAWVIVRTAKWIGGMLAAAAESARHEDALRDLGGVLIEKQIPPTTLHVRTCGGCGRQAKWRKPFNPELGARFDAVHLCGICKAHGRSPIEIDLEHFADADAIRVYLGGADVIRDAHP